MVDHTSTEDETADVRPMQKEFSGDSKETGDNLYGCLKQVSRHPTHSFSSHLGGLIRLAV